MYKLSPEELDKLHKILLEILLEVDKICKKHNIKYMLDGGTLLGSVRHKGFIPWDDDLDILMTRENYVKFKYYALKELNPDKYFYQDRKTDPNYPWGYARIRRKNSVFVRLGHEHIPMKTGIFLDIFPRDNISDFLPLRVIEAFIGYITRKIAYSEVGKKSEKNELKRFLYCVINLISKDFNFKIQEKLIGFVNKKPSENMRNYSFPVVNTQGFRLCYPREWFEEIIEGFEFEGYKFPSTKYWKEYLSFVYGDYMELPPPEKRRWHPCSEFKLPSEYEEKLND